VTAPGFHSQPWPPVQLPRRGATRRSCRITFTLSITLDGSGYTRHKFTGRVKGDAIEGEVRMTWPRDGEESGVESMVLPWRATRTRNSAYFAPTGVGPK